MNANDQPFAEWLADKARAAGYDVDSPRGDRKTLADAAGINKSLIGRTLRGSTVPDVRTQRALAKALNVPLREMLIRSGTVAAEDLPGPDTPPPPPVEEVDLYRVARKLGIPDDKTELFVRIVESNAQAFADPDTSANVGRHTHARGRSAEGE